MTDHPIIFSAPMVRALIDGRKTQTRRLITRRNSLFDGGKWPNYLSDDQLLWRDAWVDDGPSPAGNPGPCLKLPVRHGGKQTHSHRIYPRIQPGDRLWVREAWRVGAWDRNYAQIAVDYCDGPRKEWLPVDDGDMLHRLINQSREDAEKKGVPLRNSYYEYSWSPGRSPCRWRPSIHMPRWASRITLDVTDVRVQRLNVISMGDALQEGLWHKFERTDRADDWFSWGDCEEWFADDPRRAFATLWDSIHGPDAWAQNPWVITLTFTVNHHASKGGA